jgi:hypothetical protein
MSWHCSLLCEQLQHTVLGLHSLHVCIRLLYVVTKLVGLSGVLPCY